MVRVVLLRYVSFDCSMHSEEPEQWKPNFACLPYVKGHFTHLAFDDPAFTCFRIPAGTFEDFRNRGGRKALTAGVFVLLGVRRLRHSN